MAKKPNLRNAKKRTIIPQLNIYSDIGKYYFKGKIHKYLAVTAKRSKV
jgi:hypothetical protein